VLDFSTYRLCLGGWLNLDLFPVLQGQPLQLKCNNRKVSAADPAAGDEALPLRLQGCRWKEDYHVFDYGDDMF
jgi:hypothetical protein